MSDTPSNSEASGSDASKLRRYRIISWVLGALCVVLAASLCLTSCNGSSSSTNASNTTTQNADETVFMTNDFEYWSEDSSPKQVLYDFVKNAVDPNSDGYIPEEYRVAVFDMDGTLLSETNPYYFEWMMFFYRVLDDPDYQAPEEIKEFVENVAMPAVYAGDVTDEIDAQFSKYQAQVYEGMTMDEYEKFVQQFMDQPVNGQNDLTYGESFYMPMRNVVDFLQDNDFKVYVVSGADRLTTRAAVTKELGIPADHVIASDSEIKASNQGDENGEFYSFTADQEVIRGSELIKKNLKTNKVTAIAREIGTQPVLAFGNSSGDESMAIYTITDNPYPAEAFLLLCDDTERDHGNVEKAEKVKEMAEKDGFNTISMKDDFVTIYPEKATLAEIQK